MAQPRARLPSKASLNNGETFAWRLARGLDTSDPEAQVVHVATDGESYGHHHRHGEMALSYALRFIEDKKLARLINYGQFLAQFPPKWGGGDRGRYVVELCPRYRALALRLRLQWRSPGLEPAMAGAASRRS